MAKRMRQERARADILAAAARILARHGYHGTSMRELARATGRGLSSYYNYFPSKEALLFELQVRAFETLNASARAATRAAGAADGQLYAFILNHVGYVGSHFDVMRVLVQEAKVLAPPQRRRVRRFKEAYFRIGQDIVQRLSASRSSGRAAGAELERTTYSLFGMLNWTYGWYEPSRHGPEQALARTIYRLALRGLTGKRSSAATEHAVEHAVQALSIRSLISATNPTR